MASQLPPTPYINGSLLLNNRDAIGKTVRLVGKVTEVRPSLHCPLASVVLIGADPVLPPSLSLDGRQWKQHGPD